MNESQNHEPKNVPPRVVDLVSELTDGSLSAEGREELRELLAASPAAFDWYCQWMRVHSLLYLDLQHPSEAVITPKLDKSLSLDQPWRAGKLLGSKKRRWALGLSAATITALAASLLIVANGPTGDLDPGIAANRPGEKLRATPELIAAFQRTEGNAVAVLSRAADAAWGEARPLAVGSPVVAGKFAIASGVVQLEFLSGANVVIEGPARLDLKSTMLVVCHEGKLRAHVPPHAKGFMIDTPHHRAVDLGTEFAVNVAKDQSAEVHVLDGEVELLTIDNSKNNREPRNLRVGDALSAQPSGELTEIAAAPDKFIGAEELLSRSKEESASRLASWREESGKKRENPNLVAYFSFENHSPWQRSLRQDAPGEDRPVDGALVGCRWAEGRWPGKQALEFKSTEDRVLLNIPGEYESISLACWVRIDGFDRWLSSLLLTDGHDVGEVHWQFTETGQLLLGVKADPDQSQEYLSETVLRPVDLGRWIHLACVYNKSAREVTHFVDGRRVHKQPIVKGVPLRFGNAELGNWVPQELKDHRIRSLNGRMDEFAMLKVALSDAEVKLMYEAGRPH
jgi:hypothetical protein